MTAGTLATELTLIVQLTAPSGWTKVGLVASRSSPRPVRVVPHLWIPMPDGRRLAARLWLPEDAARRPVPAVVEYHPYRKNDLSAISDATRHAFMAGYGYGCLRVDMAGTGDSDGTLLDEYLPQEQEDALAVISWAADQAWCTGAVGMLGVSWGGFNALQVAARQPPALRAVVSACATDDRYADDVHYMGGCVIGSEMLSWATSILALSALPPDPDVVGERWMSGWLSRIEQAGLWVDTWLSHAHRDDYWKQGSVGEDYAAVGCPVYLVAGWADGYRNGALRLAASLPGPVKLLVGPWGHGWPHDTRPGPQIGFWQEAVRWWDHWLKGEPNGIMDEPPVRLWMQEAVRPSTNYRHRPGRWIAERGWLSPRVSERVLWLGETTLDERPSPPPPELPLRPLQHRGRLAPASDPGPWCAAGRRADFPGDQRAADGESLAFVSRPLAEDVEILGQPIAELELAADRPIAQVAVRLCDVWPDGASTLITRGILNLTHATGHETPVALVPGQTIVVRNELQAIAYRIPAGHRLRLSIDSVYWPLAWPPPEPAVMSMLPGRSRLRLPFRQATEEEPAPPDLPEPAVASAPAFELLEPSRVEEPEIRYRAASEAVDVVMPRSGPGIRLEDGRFFRITGRDIMSTIGDDPLSATATASRSIDIGRDSWQTRVDVESSMSCTKDTFVLRASLTARLAEEVIAERQWEATVARDLV